MSDDYVNAARCAERAIAAAYAAQNAYPPTTAEQELDVWRQALLEQRALADSNRRALVTMVAVCLVTNVMWALAIWWPR